MSSFLMPLSRSICSRTGRSSLFSTTTSSSLNMNLWIEFRLGDIRQRQGILQFRGLLHRYDARVGFCENTLKMPAPVQRSVQGYIDPFPKEAYKIGFFF